MITTNDYLTDSQTQLKESQKKFTELWSESQKELKESQKKLTEVWTESLPKKTTQASPSENFEKTMNFQRELINSVINTQQVTARLAIDMQKQFWDDYFQTTQKMSSNVKANEQVNRAMNSKEGADISTLFLLLRLSA